MGGCVLKHSFFFDKLEKYYYLCNTFKERVPTYSCWNSFLFYNKEKIGGYIMAYMSQKGYNELTDELKRLETVDRPRISAAIGEARDKGDISENAEYDAAREEQGMLEMKINQLKETIANAKIIDESKLNTEVVQILNTVELKNVKSGMEMKYTIVSESEANLRQGKISVKTPIARGLLGKKVSDIVEIQVPQGKIQLEILKISI